MEPLILDGKQLASNIKHDLRRDIVEHGLTPSLAIILVGDDPASHLYVQLKEKSAHQIGVEFNKYTFSHNAQQQEIIDCITWLNQDDSIDAILVQLPLPKHIDETVIMASIDPTKDADGFLPNNITLLEKGKTDLRPAPAQAVIELIKAAGQPLSDKHAVVIANNDIFFKPIKLLLEKDNVSVQYVNPGDTEMLVEKAPTADILITAIGKPHAITLELVKEDAIVIDVGTNKLHGKLVGDVHFDEVRDIVSAITPVPGGVGPVTIACLLQNVVTLHKHRSSA